MSKRWWRRLSVSAGLVLVVLLLRFTVFRPKPVPVTVYKVATGRVEDTVVNSRAGTVKSRLRAEMSPGIAGLVDRIAVKKGEKVRKGQVLLLLDDEEYRAQVNLAERSLEAARSQADQACLTADQAARDRARAESLARDNLVSPQALEEARTKAESAAAACRAAHEQVKQAGAAVAAAQATLDKTVMVAPFDGVVLEVTTEVGEWISPSPPGVFIPPVIDLISPDSLYVEAPLDEADVARVHVGLPARITMDAFRGRSFPAHVTYVSSFVQTHQEQNRTLGVEAIFLDSPLPQNLVAGLSADLEIILDAREDVLRIPSYALLEGDRVLLVEDDKLVARPVQTGLHNWQFTEITGGLSPGDEVVVSLDRPEVKEGVRVRVTREGLSRISRTFLVGDRPVEALKAIDLRIDAGDYVSVMGPSGSGKSTLLNILGCLDRPTTGSYQLDGQETARMTDRQLARVRRYKIGFVFQFFHLIPRLTAAENVEMPMVFAGIEPEERKARVKRALDSVALAARSHHRPDQLSGGERQRVAIARAVVLKPAILLADEPTGNLDSKSGGEIVDLIEEMNAAGLTLVVVTHDPAIGGRAQRRVRLADGCLVADERGGGEDRR